MGRILIDIIRINGFRGLDNLELSLQDTTVLTGANNAGKTSVLKALQLVLGNRSFLTTDDLNIKSGTRAESIIVDIRIIPTDENNKRAANFDDDWEAYFTDKAIKYDDQSLAYIPIRTKFVYNHSRSDFDKQQRILKLWESNDVEWFNIETTKEKVLLDALPFFYLEAQRDVVEDLKFKSSYLGRMMSQISQSYSKDDIEALESIIEELNNKAIEKSEILSIIQAVLSGIDTTIDNKGSNVTLSPFAKKIRDLNKTISIQYGENDNSFTMEYHGMGTRSWSSLLAFKAFIKHITGLTEKTSDIPIYPIIAIEEPEAHLHPNEQKKLYRQIQEISGQKIISSHSPYVVASANLYEVRHLYKSAKIRVGHLDEEALNADDYRKIKQKVVNTKGEIIFSKCIVFFEGETEEQALPILAQKYFKIHPSEIGIDFVGVGGAGNYFPFIEFANQMQIPWFIFSDGEPGPVADMSKAVEKCYGDDFHGLDKCDNVIVIDNGDDFEKYIIRCDYLSDIKEYLKSQALPQCVNDQHRQKKIKEIDAYTSEYILTESKNNKTKYALVYANAIAKSSKDIPELFVLLFERIKNKLT